eukprot:601619-Prymnesium_polylepis.1
MDAKCHDCGDVTSRAAAVFSALPMLFFAAVGCGASLARRSASQRVCGTMLKKMRTAIKLWRRAGMRCKLKAIVGFYQCISAIPTVYNLVTPPGLEEYTRWINLIELPSVLGIDLVIVRAACFGNYRRRLIISSCWPILFLLIGAGGIVGWELLRAHFNSRSPASTSHSSTRTALYAGLQRSLPLTLMMTFLLVPSTATQIFKTFLCDSIEYDESETRRYLHDDLSLQCTSPEYATTRTAALVFALIWPVG